MERVVARPEFEGVDTAVVGRIGAAVRVGLLVMGKISASTSAPPIRASAIMDGKTPKVIENAEGVRRAPPRRSSPSWTTASGWSASRPSARR
jgi:hypothetical protein